MKRIISILASAVLCFALTGCAHHKAPLAGQDSDNLCIRILKADIPVSGMGLTCYLGDRAVGSIGMKEASGGHVTDDAVTFVMMKEDFPENPDLDRFGFQLRVTDENGADLSAGTMYFPARFGMTYSFKLIQEGNCFTVQSE